jgi:nucleoredoxin
MYSNAFKAKGMEIVFVSSDKDQASFDSYFAEQPWVALPYEKRDIKAKLSKKFKVNGIPSFVIVDANGVTITKEGRDAVSKDPTGEKYPWQPRSILDCLGPELLAQTGGKPIGLYFSGHWCPPCRGFTPKLAEWYNNGLKDKMEIVFVSSDKDQASFDSYFKEMPWLALPFDRRADKEDLSTACGVEGIPSFAVIQPDGTVVTTDGRSKVSSDPTGENFPAGWLPQPFNDVNDDPSPLNEEQSLIIFGEAGFDAVKSVAQEHFQNAGQNVDSMSVRFFSAKSGQIGDQVRKLTGVQGDKLVLLDIPDSGAFYVCDKTEFTEDVVKGFLADVADKKIDRQQLQK